MSEQEFELYLRLMSRLLKLSQAQERAISEELRDHMEERFTELVRAGLPREKAIERALMEFGDAASLAQEFSALATRRRRRRFWRMSLAGTTLAALLTVGLVSMWPMGRPQNAPPQELVAQETAPAKEGAPARSTPEFRIRAVDPARVIPAELNVAVEFDMPDNSLKEVFDYLSQTQGLPVMVDYRAFGDAGLNDEETRMTMAYSGPLAIALDQACAAAHRGGGTQIDWSYRDQVLRFTTAEAQRDLRFVRSYDASRLVAHGIRVASLPSLLARASSSEWEPEEPGTSNINPIGTQLVISAGARQHREIAALMLALEEIFKGDADVIWSDEATETLKAEKALDRPFEIEFPDNTLKEVIEYVVQVTEQPILFDYPALADAGVNPEEEKVVFRLAERPLRTALELLLNGMSTRLVIVPRLGTLWVTTAEKALEYETTAVYRVAEFEQAGVLSELISTIHATTGPWERDEPGTGSLQQPHPHLFVIRQTAAVHRQIQRLIEEQRRTLPVISAEERAALDEKVTTRLYRLAGEKEDDLVTMIQTTIEPQSWGHDGDPKAEHWIRRVRVDGPSAGLGGMGGGLGGGGGGFGGGGMGGGGFFQLGGLAGPEQPMVQCQPMKATVLLIHHTRAAHRRIDSLLHAIRATASSGHLAAKAALLDPVITYGVEVELP